MDIENIKAKDFYQYSSVNLGTGKIKPSAINCNILNLLQI